MKLSLLTFLLFSVVYCQNFYSGFREIPKRFLGRFTGRHNRRPFHATPPFTSTEEDRSEIYKPLKWPTERPLKPAAITGGSKEVSKEEYKCECGEENAQLERVVGGREVSPRNRYPWMALIINKNEPLCGGAVINDRFVVTAAHCIDVCEESNEERTSCKVVLGVHNVNDSGAEIYEVEKLIKHEGYRLFINDIGLIKLKSDIKFSNSVRTICLPQQWQQKDIKPYNQSIMTAGWGLTASGKPSDVLMQFRATDWLKDDKSKSRFCKDLLCLKPGEGRFESGDSGGPAWITVKKRAFIVGIVSHYRLHRMRLTRVPLVKNWIVSHTESAHYCH